MRASKAAAAMLCVTVILPATTFIPPARAQTPLSTIYAAAAMSPPQVMARGGQPVGFRFELRGAIVAKPRMQSKLQIEPSGAQGLLDANRSKDADVVATPACYSTERDQDFDFT